MSISVKDSSTWRVVPKIYVNDSGTWRTIKNAYVNDFGTWRQVFDYEILNASMVQGQLGPVGVGAANYYGFWDTVIGTLTPKITNVGAVDSLYYLSDSFGANVSVFQISGISSDPGETYILSVKVGAITATVGGASYGGSSFSSGSRSWVWTGNIWSLDGFSTSSVLVL